MLQIYILRVKFNDLSLLLIASLGRLVRCHRLLLRFQHPSGGICHDSQFLLLIMLATSDKQRLLRFLLRVIGGAVGLRFEVVPLVCHVWCVQKARGHRFALLY